MTYLEKYSGSKKLTIVLVPDATGNVRQFRLSNSLLILLVCLMVISGFFLTWFVLEHQWVRGRNQRLIQVQKENKEHQREFLRMADRIAKIRQEADELKFYYGNVKATLDRVAGDRHARRAGMGGSDPGLFQADFPATSIPDMITMSVNRQKDR